MSVVPLTPQAGTEVRQERRGAEEPLPGASVYEGGGGETGVGRVFY